MSTITIETFELRKMLQDAAEMGALKALRAVGHKDKDEISQRKAHQMFGKAIIERLERNKIIKGKRKGTGENSKINYSKSEIENALKKY